MSKSRLPLFAALAIVATLVGFMAGEFMRPPDRQARPLLSGTVLPNPKPLPDFQLINSDTQPFTRQQLQGRWNVLFFGYTNCPDVCPTTLSTLAQVDQQLADLPNAQRPRVIFISVDPRRDTPAQMQRYIHFFSPEFIGLTGSTQQLQQLTQSMGVPVEIHDENGGDAYTVDHAATLFLIDPQARMAAIFSAPHSVAKLSADWRSMIAQKN